MPDEKATTAVAAILTWRKALLVDTGENRAARARLRRCATINETLFEARAIRLLERVGEPLGTAFPRERAIVLAMALADVEADGKTRFAALLGQTREGKRPAEGERPRLAPIRFRALIEAAKDRDWDRFIQALRRAHAVADHAPFDVARFVADVLFLNDAVLQRWTYEYWQSPAPADLSEATEDRLLEETP